jgi:hypothetical protein
MTEEFRNLETDAAKLRPRGLRPEVQARLVEQLREEGASMRLEADLRGLAPTPLSDHARRQTVAAAAAIPAPRHWGRWLAMAAAAAAIVTGGVLVMNFQADKPLNGDEMLIARSGLRLLSVTPLPSARTSNPEYAAADTIRTYMLKQQDGGVIRLPNGKCVRQVSYDMIDEVRRPSQQVPGRYCIERVPRREVMYVSVPAE